MRKFTIAVGLACLLGAAVPSMAEDYGVLAGSYRVLWKDGTANDHTFTIERIENLWYMSDGEKRRPLWEYDTEFRIEENFVKSLNNKNVLNAPCLDSGGASRIRICAIKPGEILNWHGEELTVSTGYFIFDSDTLFLQLEKLRQH